MTGRRVLVLGGVYLVCYGLGTTFIPRPESVAACVVLATLALVLPAVLALGATAAATLTARGAERAFWALLATGSLLFIVNALLFALSRTLLPGVEMLQLARLGYHNYLILVTVALVMRPDAPRAPGEGFAVTLEWVMAAVGVYFLLVYFVLLPAQEAGYPWPVVHSAEEAIPGLLALYWALTVREEPFRTVYRLLTLGFLGAVITEVPANWVADRGAHLILRPLDVGWMVPFFPLTAAALLPRGPTWVRPHQDSARDARRRRIALLSVAAPPFLDIAMRVFGVQPRLAESRSNMALGVTALLSVLVALRIRSRAAPPPVNGPLPEGPPPPSELLQLASGVAHELNNPLMAVGGWAELALRRGGEPEPLEALIAATRKAAGTVAWVRHLAQSGGGEPPGEP
jgi:hypothetical protein